MSRESQAFLCERVGFRLARKLFERRGNHSEMHVSESELAYMLAAAAHLGIVGATVPMGEVNSEDRAMLAPSPLLSAATGKDGE